MLFLLFKQNKQDVEDEEACKSLCLNSNFRCHSFDFGDTGEKVCRLSHHSASSLSQIQVMTLFG